MGVTIDHYIQVTENFLPRAQQIGPRERVRKFFQGQQFFARQVLLFTIYKKVNIKQNMSLIKCQVMSFFQ